MANEDLFAKASKQYPDWAWALNTPDVGDLIRKALDDPGYDESRLVSDIQQTNWYKQTQASAREYDARTARDPESANAQQRAKEAEIWDKLVSSGNAPDVKVTQELAKQALRLGWTDNQLTDAIVGRTQYSTEQKAVGSVGVAQDQVKQLAAKYYIPISDETAFNYGKGIAAGEHQLADFEVGFRDQAKGRFPTMEKEIDRGISPSDYFSPYQQRISQLLEIPATSVDFLNDTKWSKVLDTTDDKGIRRPMTLSETDTYVRGLDDWKKTRQGQQSAADTAQSILQIFGKVA